ncbi:MAG: carbamoyltransferase HypF [Thiotrichaceae bacterium]|nr:MAG: carbamoyltransferase HypF [Thiotrichaceae bacterium]
MDTCLKNNPQTNQDISARKITLSGQVQGVGFRPFIYRLATEHQLTGWVRNCVGIVEIHAQGSSKNIEHFLTEIFDKKPPLAKPKLESDKRSDTAEYESFDILESETLGEANISVPNDLYLCDDCLAELNDPDNRRYRYPFINCTQCGPRYTLIRHLPYDRPNTTMADFVLCPSCLAEYEDPNNRRFHAEPVACSDCGPSLVFHSNSAELNKTICNDNDAVLKNTVEALHQGRVVAVKGIGGYHLMCDATHTEAVSRLRNNKPRPDKALAVMFPAPVENPCKVAESYVLLTAEDKIFLLQPARPILLVAKKQGTILSEQIAPGLNEVGIMLPYSPLHHLLLNEFGRPLVVTSANISGEPVLIDNLQIEKRLKHVADACLHHNRPIQRPADDPVFRTIANKPRPIRIGRGSAPLEMVLPFELAHPVLAVGAQMKNTVTLAWKNRAVISPHIGEMNTPRSVDVFENTIKDLQDLYGVKIEQLICDAHPGYTTTRWANKQKLPVRSVMHHHAHASASYYECESAVQADEAILAFTWDGVGYGEDGTLWGGETFLGKPGEWKRVASLKPFYLAGADKAGREPWRSAAAMCWEIGQSYEQIPEKGPMLKQAWLRKINAPQSSSVGRLFDAVAALTGVRIQASFEGQGPMELEALCSSLTNGADDFIDIDLEDDNKLLIINWKSLIVEMTDSTLSPGQRSAIFHSSLAHNILKQAKIFRKKHGINTVSLCGGVFQNKVLSEKAMTLLSVEGFKVCLPELIPVNDAGISFGQVIEYGYRH